MICIDLAFQGSNVFFGMIRSVFKHHLVVYVKNVPFIFNNEFYKQMDRVAMGILLGPLFANLFLCYYEKLWLERCPLDFKPIMFRKYVNDTFVIFKEEEHAQLFFEYLNAQHSNIKVTMDKEHNNKLPLMYILIETK